MNAFLVARKLRDSESHTCPVTKTDGPTIIPLVGGHTFQSFATILSGATGLLSTLIILFLIFQHARHYSSPVQQRQIIRILLLVPWVCFFSFLIVWQIKAGLYLVLALDVGCSFALASFLLLMCDYVLSNQNGFQELFGSGANKNDLYAPNSPVWLKKSWYAVLQFIPTSIILWIATVISLAAGTYCANSNSIHFAHIWITVLKGFVTAIAVLSSIKFYKQMKPQLVQHNVMKKLISFKGIIGLNALQSFIINILVTKDFIKPTKYMTIEDFQTGLPSLIMACEMPIFAILLFICFPVSPYQAAKPQHGILIAMLQAMNLSDLLGAFVRGPMRMVRLQQEGLSRQGSFTLLQADEADASVEGAYMGRGNTHV
ncbi:hypothetical protein K504DRAFT_535464 [Pleomassaria siparia CBS 279.74]|uniref:DUF300-domain-containing protein n=1 Tax=Pleomassaria siparia CBS 279.74 TaxID=1314801 RepID=A0A6G1K4R0_9PLEO|nr:hypothetical protein K504DRAFT_535464 [Pleomassaria siparia CBS 279.74]